MNNISEIYRFKIVTNSANQRIMIVGDDYRHFSYEPVPFEAFDAIFFETEDNYVLKRQFGSLTGARHSPNYTLKPIFFRPAITSSSTLIFADGLCLSIDDEQLIKETKRINDRFRSFGFRVYDRPPAFWTPENRMFHVVRTYILRSDEFPQWELNRDSSLGYAIPRLEILFKLKVVTVRDAMLFSEKIRNNNLVKHDDLAAIVHVCSSCFENKHIWEEVCPKCGTIDIEEDHMIHHFRCANISPETTYFKDGKMICPKCNHELKHIGVDYDRPAAMYHCKHDNIHFSDPVIKALCTNCKKLNELTELKRARLYKTSYTTMGHTVFTQYDHVQDSDDMPKLPSIYAFNSFVQTLKIRMSIAQNDSSLHLVLFRLRVTPDDNYEMIERKVIHRVYKIHPNAVISYKDGAFYALHAFVNNGLNELIAEMLPLDELNRENPDYSFDGEYVELDNRDVDSIIASL